MVPKILLLDCSEELRERISRKGYDVEFGSVGYSTGVKQLPCQIYERDIIIYNPSETVRGSSGNYLVPGQIEDKTPEFNLHSIIDHVKRGAVVLSFLKKVADEENHLQWSYSWIPGVPSLQMTKDSVVIPESYKNTTYDYLNPLIYGKTVATPVEVKMNIVKQQELPDVRLSKILYSNRNNNVLGIYYIYGTGEVFLLPSFTSNDDIVMNFLRRVVPKIFKYDSGTKVVDLFKSPQEIKLEKKVLDLEKATLDIEEKLESTQENLNQVRVDKANIIKKDDTAVLLVNYYDLALEQEDVSLFYLYKITDSLKKKFGSQAKAKKVLKCNEKWNFIRKLSNTSYADIRHAPEPGEKIKDWTEEEITQAFEYTRTIIQAYLKTLF